LLSDSDGKAPGEQDFLSARSLIVVSIVVESLARRFAWDLGQTLLDTRDVRMLESSVELLGGLCLGTLTLLIGFCILGSIVAALRAVNRGSGTAITRR
jgi:hypothetical protein